MRSTRPFLVGVPAFLSAILLIALPLGAADFQILHSFDLPPGNVQAALTQVDGLWYGASYTGGAFDQGSVFVVMPDGSARILHSFAGPDGARPSGRPVWVDSAPGGAALYGTTAFGGAANGGTLYRISLDGVFTSLYSFGVGDKPLQALQAGLTPEGDLYGTASYGGPYGGTGYGGVFRLHVPTGNVEVLHAFTGGLDGVYPWRAELVPGPGGLYGVTYGGGAAPGGGVFRVATQEPGAGDRGTRHHERRGELARLPPGRPGLGRWVPVRRDDVGRRCPLPVRPAVAQPHVDGAARPRLQARPVARDVRDHGPRRGRARQRARHDPIRRADFAGAVYRVSPREGALPATRRSRSSAGRWRDRRRRRGS